MKALCPITGIPFRTYDSLTMQVASEHPVFAIPYNALVLLLEDIRIQEEEQIKSINDEQLALREDVKIALTAKDLTNVAIAAIHEKNWRNPVFKLYQTKQLVMLAFMKHAELLENENGYAARPSPQIIDAYFWEACRLFIWAAGTITKRKLPRYRVTRQNEDMGNFVDYLTILQETEETASKQRTITEENALKNMEFALAILSKRREAHKINLTAGNNHLAAKWALTITRCPKDIFPFWYGILSSPSTKVTFEGVKIDEKYEAVTIGDLRELRDYLEDNLIGPRGEHKKTHLDDGEYYFMARQTVLNIIRRHIAIIEQGTTSFHVVNTVIGEEVLSASDDNLEKQALEYGLNPKPDYRDYVKKFEFLRAMAAWRHSTKTQLLDLRQTPVTDVKMSKEERNQYEIL